jgi:hypothetical protein
MTNEPEQLAPNVTAAGVCSVYVYIVHDNHQDLSVLDTRTFTYKYK